MPDRKPTPIVVQRRLNGGRGAIVTQGRSHLQLRDAEEIDTLIADLAYIRDTWG